jgi:hypothetical protein
MSWLRRLRSTMFGSSLGEDFAEETQFHLDERIDEYVKSGMTYDRPESKLTAAWETSCWPETRRAMSTLSAGSAMSVKTCVMRCDNCDETPDLLLPPP